MSRTHVLTALALVIASAIGFATLGSSDDPVATASPPPIRVEGSGGDGGGGGEALVHVAGAVRRPGVYRLREGMRVDDALRLAGGPTRRAELTAVNLAAEVQDGRQVVVPERARRTAGPPNTPGEVPAGAGVAPGAPVNLNTATLEQLDALDGIGPATAQSILDFREEHGGFGSVEELGQIPGIGEKRLATLREAVTV